MKHLITAIALPLTLAACATTIAGPVVDSGPIRTDGMARIDEPTRVGAAVITPKRVVEDSRCPINARCVWAGRVILTARIDGPGWRETANLTLGETYRTHGVGIALTSVEPGKMAGAEQPSATYLFGFEPR